MECTTSQKRVDREGECTGIKKECTRITKGAYPDPRPFSITKYMMMESNRRPFRILLNGDCIGVRPCQTQR